MHQKGSKVGKTASKVQKNRAALGSAKITNKFDFENRKICCECKNVNSTSWSVISSVFDRSRSGIFVYNQAKKDEEAKKW